jgi:hypothetical protein
LKFASQGIRQRRLINFAEQVPIMAFTETLQAERIAMRQRPGLTFVDRDEFCRLLLSFRKLIRDDEPSVRARGLLDVRSGERYLIEQERLVSANE